MKTLMTSMLVALVAVFLAPLASAITFEWDPAPAADGPVTYTVEKKADGETTWSVVGSTANPVFSISTVPPVRTLYRLKITNLANQSVYDSNILADRPSPSSSFRIRPPSGASLFDPENLPALVDLFRLDLNDGPSLLDG